MEQGNFEKSWTHITNPEAAKVLSEEDELRYLDPFIRREYSLTEAAKKLSVSPSAMLYQVKKFVRLELLKVVRTEPRRGRATKYYRATSERFFVPFEATSAETVFNLLYSAEEHYLREFLNYYVRTNTRAPESWGIGVFLTREGGISKSIAMSNDPDPERLVDTALEKDFPAVWSSWSTLRLDFEKAKALQLDLIKLFELYKTHHSGDEQQYLLHLALCPMTPGIGWVARRPSFQ